MATQGVHTVNTFVAGADLSTSKNRFVTETAGSTVLSSAGAMTTGVLQNNPENGQVAAVATDGRVKVVSEATITSGDLVAVGAAGGAAAVGTNVAVAIARSDAAAGEMLTVDLTGSVNVQP